MPAALGQSQRCARVAEVAPQMGTGAQREPDPGPDGKAGRRSGRPAECGIGESWITVPSRWPNGNSPAGKAPTGPDQVVIDKTTSEETGYGIGSKVTVLLPSGSRVQPTVVGTAQASLSSSGAGATLVSWDLPTAEPS